MPTPESQQTTKGFTLIEMALTLTVMAVIFASIVPLQRSLQHQQRSLQSRVLMDQWMVQLESFSLVRRRLPCPASDSEGNEQATGWNGPCLSTSGLLPWRSLGLPRPDRTPFYAVASLETLGPPFAHSLTTTDALKSLVIDQLSAAIYSPPDTNGSSPGTLPALLVQAPETALDDQVSLTGMPCGGTTFLTVSAAAIVSTDWASGSSFSNGSRCFTALPSGSTAQFAWLSYERLIWLYVRAGMIGPA